MTAPPPPHVETLMPEEPLGADPQGRVVATPQPSSSAATGELCPILAQMAAHRICQAQRKVQDAGRFGDIPGRRGLDTPSKL
ncbi:hypothetical protein NL676_035088 [Syzygium grande]|nr:hypothetical protein NL676_035088 [Syzygium grande]